MSFYKPIGFCLAFHDIEKENRVIFNVEREGEKEKEVGVFSPPRSLKHAVASRYRQCIWRVSTL